MYISLDQQRMKAKEKAISGSRLLTLNIMQCHRIHIDPMYFDLLYQNKKIYLYREKENIYKPLPVHSSSHQQQRMIQQEYLYMQEVNQ